MAVITASVSPPITPEMTRVRLYPLLSVLSSLRIVVGAVDESVGEGDSLLVGMSLTVTLGVRLSVSLGDVLRVGTGLVFTVPVGDSLRVGTGLELSLAEGEQLLD
jgi:hypothetical protein